MDKLQKVKRKKAFQARHHRKETLRKIREGEPSKEIKSKY